MQKSGKLESFIKELQKYLISRISPYDFIDGKPEYKCNINDKWTNFYKFCELKGYDWEEVVLMINEYSGLDCDCECWILNSVEVPD